MNISDYLRSSHGNAWLMNDGSVLKWENKQWTLRDYSTASYSDKPAHKILYQGASLSQALKIMKGIPANKLCLTSG